MTWSWTDPNEHVPNQGLGASAREGEALTDCPDCGRSRDQGQNYCSGCGYRFARSFAGSEISAIDADPTSAGAAGRANRRRKGVTWGGGQIIAGIILVILSLFTAAAAAAFLSSLYPEQEDAVATWISVHLMALGIAATVWFLGLRHTTYPMAVLRLSGIQLPRMRTVLLMVAVLATSLSATVVYAVIVDLLGVEALVPEGVESDIFFDGAAVLLTFLALAFITPLSEEVFFRGFIFNGLLARMGPWGAMVVSALVFSAFHLSIAVVIPIFITGFLFAWLYWRTGSLWAAIGAHAGQNALALSMQAFVG